jgi:hypothetical protein
LAISYSRPHSFQVSNHVVRAQLGGQGKTVVEAQSLRLSRDRSPGRGDLTPLERPDSRGGHWRLRQTEHGRIWAIAQLWPALSDPSGIPSHQVKVFAKRLHRKQGDEPRSTRSAWVAEQSPRHRLATTLGPRQRLLAIELKPEDRPIGLSPVPRDPEFRALKAAVFPGSARPPLNLPNVLRGDFLARCGGDSGGLPGRGSMSFIHRCISSWVP